MGVNGAVNGAVVDAGAGNGALPPGPPMPSLLQTIGWWARPTAILERCRARYGGRFTVRLTGQSPFVVISDPDEIKQVFQAPPDVLHPGEGAHILEPVVGPNSVILLDEDPHIRQRKLLLGPFHGESMQRLTGVMSELTEAEIESWPTGEPVALHPHLQRLTLEIILRTVFGLERGAHLDALRELLAEILAFGDSPISLMPPAQRLLAGRRPLAGFERAKAAADEIIYELIDERRAAASHGDDVLSLLLDARHEDDSPMSPAELRDELMTALVAGHETTASQLAWGLGTLAREPAIQARLHAEIDDGSDEAYLTATIQEVTRRQPVLPNAEPRLVVKPFECGGITYQPGVVLFASAYLVHHDPAIYEDPYAFRPERFLQQPPGTYTWIPFGGGRRRCIGASFALLEMRIVLRAILERFALRAAPGTREHARRRGISISPSHGALVVLSQRSRSAGEPTARTQGEPAVA
jgi:cytochrome P450